MKIRYFPDIDTLSIRLNDQPALSQKKLPRMLSLTLMPMEALWG
jgi:hypothetical protein